MRVFYLVVQLDPLKRGCEEEEEEKKVVEEEEEEEE